MIAHQKTQTGRISTQFAETTVQKGYTFIYIYIYEYII